MGTIGAACAAFLCWSAVQARLHGRRTYLARVAKASELARSTGGFHTCEEVALAEHSQWTHRSAVEEQAGTQMAPQTTLAATPEEGDGSCDALSSQRGSSAERSTAGASTTRSDDGQATQGATRRTRFHFSQWCHQLEWMFTFDFGDTTYTFPFPVHSRVRHVSRGLGTVVRLLENGRTEVRFDGSAEVHRYRPVPTARKLTAVKSEDGEEAPPVPLLRWLSVILGTGPLRGPAACGVKIDRGRRGAQKRDKKRLSFDEDAMAKLNQGYFGASQDASADTEEPLRRFPSQPLTKLAAGDAHVAMLRVVRRSYMLHAVQTTTTFDALAHVLREVAELRKLEHPSLLHVFAVVSDQPCGEVALLSELPAGSLTTVLAAPASEPLTWANGLLAIVARLADVLFRRLPHINNDLRDGSAASVAAAPVSAAARSRSRCVTSMPPLLRSGGTNSTVSMVRPVGSVPW